MHEIRITINGSMLSFSSVGLFSIKRYLNLLLRIILYGNAIMSDTKLYNKPFLEFF